MNAIAPAAPSGGTKHDAGKLPLELLPFDALEEVARVLRFGATKYAPRNWEKGLAHSRTIGAALRHVVAWYQHREDLDAETGTSHLANAVCELLFALAFECRGRVDLDDRPTLSLERVAVETEPAPAFPSRMTCRAASLEEKARLGIDAAARARVYETADPVASFDLAAQSAICRELELARARIAELERRPAGYVAVAPVQRGDLYERAVQPDEVDEDPPREVAGYVAVAPVQRGDPVCVVTGPVVPAAPVSLEAVRKQAMRVLERDGGLAVTEREVRNALANLVYVTGAPDARLPDASRAYLRATRALEPDVDDPTSWWDACDELAYVLAGVDGVEEPPDALEVLRKAANAMGREVSLSAKTHRAWELLNACVHDRSISLSALRTTAREYLETREKEATLAGMPEESETPACKALRAALEA